MAQTDGGFGTGTGTGHFDCSDLPYGNIAVSGGISADWLRLCLPAQVERRTYEVCSCQVAKMFSGYFAEAGFKTIRSKEKQGTFLNVAFFQTISKKQIGIASNKTV